MPTKRAELPEGALYVRLPTDAVNRLDRAADALGMRKKDLVAKLVARHVDPDSQRGLRTLGELSRPHRIGSDLSDVIPTAGSHSFQPYDPPEVLTASQAGQLLQLEEQLVVALAEAGELPGRKLGDHWRFSRAALIANLSKSTVPRSAAPRT